jgi:hypothetical protein
MKSKYRKKICTQANLVNYLHITSNMIESFMLSLIY